MRETLFGAGSLGVGLYVAHLREIDQPRRALKEAHRFDLNAHTASVLVSIDRRGRIGWVPQRIPCLVALGCVEGSALLVVALRCREVKAFADAHIVSEKIPSDGLIHARMTGKH